MEPEIGDLLDDAVIALAAERGGDDLHRLLADLAADGRLALGEQARHVGAGGRCGLALGHDALDPVEHVARRPWALERGVEAGAGAGVAGHAVLVDLHQQRVGVAVGVDALHVLAVARRLPLAPGRLPRTRPEVRETGRERLCHGLAVHPRDHQDLAGVGLLHDGGTQPALVELELVERHGSSLTVTPRSAR